LFDRAPGPPAHDRSAGPPAGPSPGVGKGFRGEAKGDRKGPTRVSFFVMSRYRVVALFVPFLRFFGGEWVLVSGGMPV